MRHSSSLRRVAATAPLRAASAAATATSSANEHTEQNTSETALRNNGPDRAFRKGRRSATSVEGHNLSTPHHQAHGRSGSRAATALMQRHRILSPYYYHTVATAPSSSRQGEVIVAHTLHSAYATTGRYVEAAASMLLQRGLSAVDDPPPPLLVQDTTTTTSASAAAARPLRVLDSVAVSSRDGGTTALSPAEVRCRRYEPFDLLLHRYIERGFVNVATLVYHPEAPAPAVLLDHVLQHRTPCAMLTEQVLLAITYAHKRTASAHGATASTSSPANHFALQRVAATLRTRCEALYTTQSIRTLLVEALLHEGLYNEVVEVLQGMPDHYISPALWAALVAAAAQSKLADSQLLWRLLSVREGHEGSPANGVLTEAGRAAMAKSQAQPSPQSGQEAPHETGGSGPAEVHGHGTAVGSVPCGPFNVHRSSVVLVGAATPPPSPSQRSEPGLADGDAAAGVPHWVQLHPAEVGYAAEHYGGLNSAVADDRGGGSTGGAQLRLHPSTYAYVSDATASIVYDKSKRSAKQAARQAREGGDTSGARAADPDPAEGVITSTFPGDAPVEGRDRREDNHDEDTRATASVSEAELAILEAAAPAMVLGSQGIVYGLDARMTAQLMLRAGVSFSGQASALLALHLLRRYLDSCHALRDEAAALQASVLSQLASVERGLRDEPAPNDSKGDRHRRHGQPRDPRDAERRLRLLRRQADVALQGSTPHPSPFLVLFKILRETRDVVAVVGGPRAGGASPEGAASAAAVGAEEGGDGSDGAPGSGVHASGAVTLPMVHWELAWRYFQLLNRENPLWYVQLPEEAGDLCFHVLEVLCRGADPWLSLNVARAASARHLVDGVDMSLWLLHHIDPSHHTDEAKEVTRKVFRWLLVDVGLHLHSRLHHHLIPVTRVLLRLGLQDELKVLYNSVLDNVYVFSEGFRDEFIEVMSDLVCPSCSSILSDADVYAERVCGNCMAVVPAKDPSTIPSFQLSAEHMRRVRERRKLQRAKARQRVYGSVGRLSAGAGADSPAAALLHPRNPNLRAPLDAAELFKQRILHSEAAPLLPGVAVSSEFALFPLPGTEEEGAGRDGSTTGAVLDVRAAMEESSRRLALQRAARQYALAQRGITSESMDGEHGVVIEGLYGNARAALPTSSLQFTSQYDRAAVLTPSRLDGPWTCVWCQEQNTAWSSRLQCSACGAETGPSAPWRQFAYAADGDVMGEIRARIAHAEERPVDAVVAAYLLMLYRRTFLLKAIPHDQERMRQLIERLCLLHERVLAAYLYTRLVPPPARRKDSNLLLLAQMFGSADTEAFQRLTRDDLRNDEVLFSAVFTPATCKVCFGAHDWRVCPIITRDFASSQRPSINLSAEEKQKAILDHLQRMVKTALEHGRGNSKLVVDAYASFVTSPFRELFAEVYSEETNALSLLLSSFKQYRRAAFVLCHMPLHARTNAAYLALCSYFNVSDEEAMLLLSKRNATTVKDDSHPNFVQVTMTCCMCLDQRHASFSCPRLHTWLAEVKKLAASSERHQLLDPAREQQTRRRLRAQVDGWTSAGPERLHAFYRFLLEHVEEVLRPAPLMTRSSSSSKANSNSDSSHRGGEREAYRRSSSDPLVYGLNRTITKLASVQQRSYAYRLYARTPAECVSVATTTAMLRLNRFSEESIRALLNADPPTPTSSPSPSPSPSSSAAQGLTVLVATTAARTAALPLKNRCLLCFHQGHAYYDCPELAAQATLADKMQYVITQVGGICASPEGVSAAAAYVYHMYNRGLLSNELLRGHSELVRRMLLLAHRCFAAKELAAGVRVLRRIPVEMVPPDAVYPDLWRAAGLPDATVEARRLELLALYDAEGLRPSVDDPPPRRTYSSRFMADLGHALHDDLCRHCYAHGHTLATCAVFQQEVGFGRDYVASYRMSMMSEQLTSDWQDAYLLKLVDFFDKHQYFMPYHIAGVANALNAIAAMWSFRNEPGIALAHLLRIPPAYRRRQAFKHILHCLQVPTAEISRVLANFYFSPDDVHAASGGQQQVVAQHLLMPKPAIRDVAMDSVFANYPAAVAALEQSEQRMERIRRRNQVGSAASSSTEAMSAILEGRGSGGDGGEGPATTAAAAFPAGTVSMQSGDISRLREDFDPILSELEDAVGMKLGSRHILFTSAVDIISGSATSQTGDGGGSGSSGSPPGSPAAAAAAAAAAASPLAAAFAAAAAAAAAASSTRPGSSAGTPAAPPRVVEAEIISETVHRGGPKGSSDKARYGGTRGPRGTSTPAASGNRQRPPQQQQQRRGPSQSNQQQGRQQATWSQQGGSRRSGNGSPPDGTSNASRHRRQGGHRGSQ